MSFAEKDTAPKAKKAKKDEQAAAKVPEKEQATEGKITVGT